MGFSSYKHKCIMALGEIITSYERPDPEKIYLSAESCSLCSIYREDGSDTGCKGCPMAYRDGHIGCTHHLTYRAIQKFFMDEGICNKPLGIYAYDVRVHQLFLNRANVLRRILMRMKPRDKRFFTPRGWCYYNPNVKFCHEEVV